MRRLLLVVPALALLAGCAKASSVPAATAPETTNAPPGRTCDAAVSFDAAGALRWSGTTYTTLGQTTLTNDDTDAMLFGVGCEGAKAYSAKGVPRRCEILVLHTDAWYAYAPQPLPTGCPTPVTQPGTRTTALPSPSPPPHSSPATPPRGGCPSPMPTEPGSGMAVDYVDSLMVDGRSFMGDLGQVPPGKAVLTDADRAAPQFTVTCTLSTWSDSYQQTTKMRDRYATFLRAGTVVYAVKGHPPLCQLMAKIESGWDLFTSTEHGCASPPPIATALPSQG